MRIIAAPSTLRASVSQATAGHGWLKIAPPSPDFGDLSRAADLRQYLLRHLRQNSVSFASPSPADLRQCFPKN
jgi:hypothetical protein